MQRRLILIAVIALISMLGRPPASEAADITVDGTTCTLVNAILAANSNSPSGGCTAGSGPSDTIILDDDVSLTSVYGPSSSIAGNKAGLPDITSTIIIQAGAAANDSISGDGSNFRIFNVTGGSLTLSGITVSGGSVSSAGGGIYIDSTGSLSLINATVTGNTVSGSAVGLGGGIYNEGTIASITNTTISGNNVQPSTTAGNGYAAQGGGIYNDGTISLINNGTVISNNVADGGDSSNGNGAAGQGGGIFTTSAITLDTVTLSGNDVTGGSGTVDGGAAAGGGYYGSLAGTTTGLVVIGNTVTGGTGTSLTGTAQGGGLWLDTVNTLTTSSVTNNTASGGSNADASGGGIYLNGAIATHIETTVITGNQVIGGTATFTGGIARGGGIHIGGSGLFRSLTVNGNSVTGGDGGTGGTGSGGGMYVSPAAATSFEDLLVESNTATGGDGSSFGGAGFGAGITIDDGSTVSITDSTIRLNTASGGTGGSGQGSGGGLWIGTLSSAVTITTSTIDGNTGNGGTGGGILTRGPTTIVNSTISGNTSTTGGGIFFFANANDMKVDFTTILNNTADTGEAIYLFGTRLTVTGSIIASSDAKADCFGVDSLPSSNTSVKLQNDSSCANIAPKNIQIGVDISSSLQNNGGPTATHALIGGPDNNAINNIPSCGLSTDQRGEPRDTLCDAGSYEIYLTPLMASADCVHPNLEVTITGGDGPFTIDATNGQNVPVNGNVGTTVVLGPEKWDDLTVQEQGGDGEVINLGQFKCRPLAIPNPLTPPHRSRTTNTSPIFSWTGIPDANRYRVFVFDNKVVADRTVDIRQNTPGGDPAPTSLVLTNPLPTKRLFWRVRGRVNRVWGYWSVRFTLFIDPPALFNEAVSGSAPTTVLPTPVLEQQPNSRGEAPVLTPPPTEEAAPIQPPNSR